MKGREGTGRDLDGRVGRKGQRKWGGKGGDRGLKKGERKGGTTMAVQPYMLVPKPRLEVL